MGVGRQKGLGLKGQGQMGRESKERGGGGGRGKGTIVNGVNTKERTGWEVRPKAAVGSSSDQR